VAKYLLEVGTEELPYKFIPSAIEKLKNSFSSMLEENRITCKEIKSYGTPRRLAVIVEEISEFQPDITKEIKGPPSNVAFDKDGNLTKAASGFASKLGISANCLFKKEVSGTEYVFAKIEEKGRPTTEVLSSLVPEIILSLQGAYFMRWGNFDIKFSRPIRWLVSMLDKQEVKINIENVESST